MFPLECYILCSPWVRLVIETMLPGVSPFEMFVEFPVLQGECFVAPHPSWILVVVRVALGWLALDCNWPPVKQRSIAPLFKRVKVFIAHNRLTIPSRRPANNTEVAVSQPLFNNHITIIIIRGIENSLFWHLWPNWGFAFLRLLLARLISSTIKYANSRRLINSIPGGATLW